MQGKMVQSAPPGQLAPKMDGGRGQETDPNPGNIRNQMDGTVPSFPRQVPLFLPQIRQQCQKPLLLDSPQGHPQDVQMRQHHNHLHECLLNQAIHPLQDIYLRSRAVQRNLAGAVSRSLIPPYALEQTGLL